MQDTIDFVGVDGEEYCFYLSSKYKVVRVTSKDDDHYGVVINGYYDLEDAKKCAVFQSNKLHIPHVVVKVVAWTNPVPPRLIEQVWDIKGNDE